MFLIDNDYIYSRQTFWCQNYLVTKIGYNRHNSPIPTQPNDYIKEFIYKVISGAS